MREDELTKYLFLINTNLLITKKSTLQIQNQKLVENTKKLSKISEDSQDFYKDFSDFKNQNFEDSKNLFDDLDSKFKLIKNFVSLEIKTEVSKLQKGKS